MTRKVKTISFSLISEYDTRLLDHAQKPERGSFSKYIKRLIDDDMRGARQVIQHAPAFEPVIEDSDKEDMSGFL